MSKKYRYLAQKRDSYNNYIVTIYLCKKYMPNNYITCKTCLSRAGETNESSLMNFLSKDSYYDKQTYWNFKLKKLINSTDSLS
jgi:hypothetical protein